MDDLKRLVPIYTAHDYRNRYGFHYLSIVACAILKEAHPPPFLPATTTTLPGSPPPSQHVPLGDADYAVFASCVKHIAYISRFLYTSQVVLRVIQDAAEKSHVRLPREMWDLFHAFDGKSWVLRAAEHVLSAYPAGARGGKDAEGVRIGGLLRQWKRMSLDEGGGGGDDEGAGKGKERE